MAEEPSIESPPAFAKMGADIAAGIIEQLSKSDLGPALGSFLAENIGKILGVLATLTAPVGIGLAKGIANAEDAVAPHLAEMAATAVSDMFGVDVPASTFSARSNRSGRSNAGTALGAGFLKAIEGQGGPLEPSDEAAKRFLTMNLTMALDGWWQGFFFEFLSSAIPWVDVGKIESFADLDDTMQQALGLGRLTRQVLGPIIDTTVVTPARWKANKQYRPNLLGAGDAIRHYQRGKWTREQLDEELARQGWSLDRIEALISNARKRLTVDQALYRFNRGEISSADLLTEAREAGYDDATAQTLLDIEHAQRVDRLGAPAVSAALSAFIGREIDEAECDRVVKQFAPSHDQAVLMMATARVQRALNRKSLSSSQIRGMVKKRLLAPADYRAALEREGWERPDAALLELELRIELDEAAALDAIKVQQEIDRQAAAEEKAIEKAAKKAEIEARNARTLPTLGELRRAIVRGRLPIDRYTQELERLKYAPEDIAFLVADVLDERADYDAAKQRQAAAEARASDADLSLPEVRTLVVRGTLDIADYYGALRARGYDDVEANHLTALVRDERDDRIRAEQERARQAEIAAARSVSLSAMESAVRRGLRTMADYTGLLTAQGASQASIALLSDLLAAQLADDATALQARREAEAQGKAPALPLATLERAVRLGLRTLDDYRHAVAALGLSPADQATLVSLLQLQIAEDDAARRRREEIAQGAQPPGLSMGQIERAVRLGLLDMGTYRAWLSAAGYGAQDTELLVSLLVEELRSTREAQARRDQVATELQARGLSLGEMARGVKRGLRGLAEYEGLLFDTGYGAEDVALLTQLLAEELEIDYQALRARLANDPAQGRDVAWVDRLSDNLASGAIEPGYVEGLLITSGAAPTDARLFVRLVQSFAGSA